MEQTTNNVSFVTQHLDDFRSGFQFFIENFNLNGDWPYKRRIRELSPGLLAGFEAFYKNGIKPEASLPVAILRVDFEHLKMTHWLPSDGDGDGILRQSCVSLSSKLKDCPLVYLPEAENIVKTMYVTNEALKCAALLNGGGDTTTMMHPLLSAFRQSLPSFQIDLVYRGCPIQIRNLKADHMERLVRVPGVVIQAFRPTMKATRLAMQCKDCGSRKFVDLPAWRHTYAMPRNCGNDNNQPDGKKCSLDPYFITSDECQWTDTQTLKIQELADDVPTGDVPRHLMLTVTNHLTGKVCPGNKILACGAFSSLKELRQYLGQSSSSSSRESRDNSYLHVLNLEFIDQNSAKEINGSVENSNAKMALRLIGSSIFDSEETRKIEALAAQPDVLDLITQSIAPSICGHEAIKLSLACLLFGGSRKQMPDGSSIRGDLNILLLGDPSVAKSQFLKFVQRAAPIAVYTSGKGSSAAGLTAAIIRDAHGNFALEGGAMVLADGGVVCIDEFDKMRDDDRVAIHEAMEQQTISIAKAGINSVLSTECSVLAAANPSFGSYDDTRDTADQHNFETTILSRFDCIWLVKDMRDIEQDKKIARHIYSLYAQGDSMSDNFVEDKTPIPLPLLKAFISHARSHCHPRLSAEAARRLGNYYVEVRESRRVGGRSRKRDDIPITIRQLESLARLSESLARMSLSVSVSVEHVERAINLFKLSTITAAAENKLSISESLNDEQINLLKNAETAILNRLPINGRVAKSTIISDLKTQKFPIDILARALSTLIAKGILQEKGNATVKRISGVVAR